MIYRLIHHILIGFRFVKKALYVLAYELNMFVITVSPTVEQPISSCLKMECGIFDYTNLFPVKIMNIKIEELENKQ